MSKQQLISRIAELLDASLPDIYRAGLDRLSIQNLEELRRLLEKNKRT